MQLLLVCTTPFSDSYIIREDSNIYNFTQTTVILRFRDVLGFGFHMSLSVAWKHLNST